MTYNLENYLTTLVSVYHDILIKVLQFVQVKLNIKFLECSNSCKTCSGSYDHCTSCDINEKRVD